jgi:Kef-type K+ transport system membrane component KefB
MANMDLLLLILQIIVILGVARLVGRLFRRIRQPQVVGEMAAGVLLGPSLLGLLAPGVYGYLFPADSLGYLNAISQIGLLIFMFLIGLELDLNNLRGRGRTTVITSQISIVVPFVSGVLLAMLLYPALSKEEVPLPLFAIFFGTALSITAFPVLARILSERKMLRTELGAVAIACAAVDDVTGWIILAVLMLLARATETALPLWAILLGVAVYVVIMLFPLRRLLCWIEDYYQQIGHITQGVLALILLFALGSAWTTEFLGIHALFGAFLAGVIMPRHHGFVHALTEKLNDFTVVFLLPLFFAYTGLRTSVGLLDSAELWLYCGLIILVAVGAKMFGGSLPARATGMSWRNAFALGTLMNTRGLMELVLLNIALDIGLINSTLFTMLVIMALTTTFMTAPLLEWIYFRRVVPPGEYQLSAPEVIPVSEDEYLPVD